MHTNESDESALERGMTVNELFRLVASTYLRGLAYMAATALAVFSAFCFYIVAASSHVTVRDVIVWPGIVCMICFVLYISRNDKTPDLKLLRNWTLWYLYLSLCGQIIEPALRIASPESDPGVPNLIVLVLAILPLMYAHYREKIVGKFKEKF